MTKTKKPVISSEYLELESRMREFWHRLEKPMPKNGYRVLALAMLDKFYGIDNNRALKRVYNRIRHCRHTLFVTTNQALDLLEDSYTYTPDFFTLPIENTIDEGETYTLGTIDRIALKKYDLEQSAQAIANKIRETELTKRLFNSMPETRYNSLKLATVTILNYYDKELKGFKLDEDEKKNKKSLQEKIRTYLIRWYKIRPTVNYEFCVAYYESLQKYERGLYDD